MRPRRGTESVAAAFYWRWFGGPMGEGAAVRQPCRGSEGGTGCAAVRPFQNKRGVADRGDDHDGRRRQGSGQAQGVRDRP